MLVILNVITIVCSICTLSAANLHDDLNYDRESNIHVDVMKELTRYIKENGEKMKEYDAKMKENDTKMKGYDTKMKGYDAKMKVFEEREAKMNEDIGKMQETAKKQEEEISRLRQMVDECKYNDASQERNSRSEDLVSRSADDARVAFSALLSADVHHLGLNQNITFDNVLVNDGNAYNPHDGLFVAPYTGTYVFSTTVTTTQRDITHYGFARNGNVITNLYVNGAEKLYDSSAQTIVLHLQAGDDVSVKHTESDKTLTGANYSLFNGFLLYRSIDDGIVVG